MKTLTDEEYDRVRELITRALTDSKMKGASFSKILPSDADKLPASEYDVTPFILERTHLYRTSWIQSPLAEALLILDRKSA